MRRPDWASLKEAVPLGSASFFGFVFVLQTNDLNIKNYEKEFPFIVDNISWWDGN